MISGRWDECQVCGGTAHESCRKLPWLARCKKHLDRNPCAIEGCKRSTAQGENPLDDGRYWICGAHWKIGVPPRSTLRRQYHRYFRLAKRHGWNAVIGQSALPLEQRFWRFWERLVAIARTRCQHGDIDQDDIDRMFGWD